MSDVVKIDLPVEAIRAYCERQPIERLSVFGSALRDD
jgi:predicted nucleotidyltransferase